MAPRAAPPTSQRIARQDKFCRLFVYLAGTSAAMLVCYVFGKEMSWDLLNYHVYLGLSALHDRFAQDYFAAGPIQSYLNPYAYVPFYALLCSRLSDLHIGLILAAAQSVVLWLTYELALLVARPGIGQSRTLIGVVALVFSFANPILLQQFGTSFADITTAIPVLGGWVLLASAVETSDARRVIVAGLLLGFATALKLTNAVHAVAAVACLPFFNCSARARIRLGLSYALGLALGFAVFATPWAWRLERTFGNPFFPLFNGIFKSPEFTSAALRDYRFIPSTLLEALWRPFAIANPVPMVYEEGRAPDIRYALLVLLAGALAVKWLWAAYRRRSIELSPSAPRTSDRALAAIGFALAVDWAIWLTTSGNGRYFLPMSCVAGVTAVAVIFRFFSSRPRIRNYLVAVIFLVQSLQLWMGTDYRWNGVPWSHGPWFEVALPSTLATEPNLYLSVGTQSNSFLAHFLAPGSGLINFSGGYAIGNHGPNGARVEKLIHQYWPHVRILVEGDRIYGDGEWFEPRQEDLNRALERFFLRLDTADCVRITVRGLPPTAPKITILHEGRAIESGGAPNTTYLMSCRVVADYADHSQEIERQRIADRVLDNLENACPELFQPRGMLTEHVGNDWRRLYMNTGLAAWVNEKGGWVAFQDKLRGDDVVVLGKVSDWLKTPPRLICGRSEGHFYARTTDSSVAVTSLEREIKPGYGAVSLRRPNEEHRRT